LPYYRAHGILRSVDAAAEMDAVTRRIDGILG
jgi:adenylate kinase family enzyme